MSRAKLAGGEYYHVFNRGVEKRNIFLDDKDRWRFLSLLFALQGDAVLNPFGRIVPLVEHRMFNNLIFGQIEKSRYIELVGFCLMANHFHLIVGSEKEGGISKYMQRLLNAYTKYFNTRYNRSGHLFGSKFQSAHIDTDKYLHYLTAYIHLNPGELKRWKKKELQYPWSSYQDYVYESRWANFLNPSLILDQFETRSEYRDLLEKTSIRKLEERLNVEHRMFNI
ncbi:transposase [Candidatus Giovannonibacteria bacterium]|nr:transposase [Candidatus Giovannonibacteria bacterium]